MRGLRPILQDVMQLFNARRKRAKAEWSETLDRHAKVVAAIQAGDGDAAFRAMEHHFEAAQDAIRELFPLQQTSDDSGRNKQKKSKTRENSIDAAS
jgi:GntR family transcriptional repressor for pyruvate dehydrogenase complex